MDVANATTRVAPACSDFTDEPLPGTATQERGWLCIENNAGWGRDPLSGDTFDPDTGTAIERFAARHDLRLLLIRRPGRARSGAHRTVFVARSKPSETSLRRFEVEHYAQIPELDIDDAASTSNAEPIALVCTNGKRDVCCAVKGRPLTAALAACYADPIVWECSHTGGHRFAPVVIVLPSGYTYGRLTPPEAKEVFDAARAGVVLPTGLRGRSTDSPPAQVADVAVRSLIAPTGPNALIAGSDGNTATVTHADGRRWRVVAAADPLPPRVASCGKSPSPAQAWRVASLEEIR